MTELSSRRQFKSHNFNLMCTQDISSTERDYKQDSCVSHLQRLSISRGKMLFKVKSTMFGGREDERRPPQKAKRDTANTVSVSAS